MNKENAEKIIDYVATRTKPRWKEWIYMSYSKLDEIFIPRGYEQGGFSAPAFFELLREKKIASIRDVGSILDNYQGGIKYSRERKGSLESPFYQDLKRGVHGNNGIVFYRCVNKFLNDAVGNPGGWFWVKLWQMLICSHHLKQDYNSSFKFYLKKQYCKFKNISKISDTDFCNITPNDWRQFMEKAYPWDELYGIGENVFDYLVRDIKEFKFAKDSFKLDAANIHFFKITGISELFESDSRDCIIKFLKELNIDHKYSVKEINAGMYTYCSETEKENYGFCRNIEKCTECKVYSICEKNL